MAPIAACLPGCFDPGPAADSPADKLDRYLADLQSQVRGGRPVTGEQAAEARKLATAVHPLVAAYRGGGVRARMERLAEVERFVDEARNLCAPAEGRPADLGRAEQALSRARDRLAEATSGL